MDNTRYEQIKNLDIDEMTEFFSFCFDCSRCPAKKGNCSENDAMCMDAIREYLNDEGQLY